MLMKSEPKAMTVTGGAAVVVTYLAGLASAKWNMPLEVAAVIVGSVSGWLGRWAARLTPSSKC